MQISALNNCSVPNTMFFRWCFCLFFCLKSNCSAVSNSDSKKLLPQKCILINKYKNCAVIFDQNISTICPSFYYRQQGYFSVNELAQRLIEITNMASIIFFRYIKNESTQFTYIVEKINFCLNIDFSINDNSFVLWMKIAHFKRNMSNIKCCF